MDFVKNEFIVGGIPCTGLEKPVEGNVFFVGDSAHQVLPLSGEGIRTSIYFAEKCARAIAGSNGNLNEALRAYEQYVDKERWKFGVMNAVQRIYLAMPQKINDVLITLTTSKHIKKVALNWYMNIAKVM